LAAAVSYLASSVLTSSLWPLGQFPAGDRWPCLDWSEGKNATVLRPPQLQVQPAHGALMCAVTPRDLTTRRRESGL